MALVNLSSRSSGSSQGSLSLLGCELGDSRPLLGLEARQHTFGRIEALICLFLGVLHLVANRLRRILLLLQFRLCLRQAKPGRLSLAQRRCLGHRHLIEGGGLGEELVGVVGKEHLQGGVDSPARVRGAGELVDCSGDLAEVSLLSGHLALERVKIRLDIGKANLGLVVPLTCTLGLGLEIADLVAHLLQVARRGLRGRGCSGNDERPDSSGQNSTANR
ncbi:unannotated protein [freshwater metagenome]|uniref:Unannotated protein n=1 Tax=freshwater metagenome TaxID=449393 RepID=A0A6J7QUV0_9ZZZZ